MRKAEAEFNSFKYVSAIGDLKKVLLQDSTNVRAQEMIAFSYRRVNNYEAALFWYEKLSMTKPVKPDIALYYAEALATAQQYEKSEQWYRKYLSMVPDDKRAVSFSRTDLYSLAQKSSSIWRVAFTNLNTAASEFSPVFYKNGLIFSSNRIEKSFKARVFPWDNSPYLNLYEVKNLKEIREVNPDSVLKGRSRKSRGYSRYNDDDTPPTSNDSRTLGQYSPAIVRDSLAPILSKTIKVNKLKGKVNTRYHDASASVFPDGSIIFTRNNYFKGKAGSGKDGVNKLKLYIASAPALKKIVEFPYNSDEYSVGHPALNSEGNILIFVSDMPGGYGGTDLYYSVRSGNQWTRPVNLGKKINTEGNEKFPYWAKDGTLYFASNGYAGLGGLDIFEVKLKDVQPQSAPRNLGTPINSPYDDFSFIISEDNKSGYFSSNRRGNDDIYHFSQAAQRIILEGTVTDARTKLPLRGSRLLLRHLDGTDTIHVNEKGQFRRQLARETDYEVTAQKLGYVSQMAFTTSVGIDRDSTIHMDLQLNKAESSQQFVINNCDSLKKVFSVGNIYYDLDRSEIRYDARPTLDALVDLMRKYPSIRVITSSHCDSRASDEYNRRLSLRRGESAKSYLVARGIDPFRIKVEYYGKTRLVNRCYDGVPCSEADQQLNRRTEFDIILNGVNLTQLNCDDVSY